MIFEVDALAATGCTRRPRRVVLAGEGDAALVEETLHARVAIIGRTVPRDEEALCTVVVWQVFHCVELEARVAAVRQVFPRRDDEDLDMRAPRDGSGVFPPDFHVVGASTAGRTGGLVPGCVIWFGWTNGETPEERREFGTARVAHEGREPG